MRDAGADEPVGPLPLGGDNRDAPLGADPAGRPPRSAFPLADLHDSTLEPEGRVPLWRRLAGALRRLRRRGPRGGQRGADAAWTRPSGKRMPR